MSQRNRWIARPSCDRAPIAVSRCGVLLFPVTALLGIAGAGEVTLWAALGAIGLVVLGVCWHNVAVLRVERLVTRAGFRICPECEYPLVDLPSEGQCPECGEAYTIADATDAWKRWLFEQRARPGV